jgi:hypothetical protein
MFAYLLILRWPGFIFWITFQLYNTDAQLEGEAAYRAYV